MIFDRHTQVLVENRYSLNISLIREQTEDLDRSLRLLAAVARIDEQALWDVVDRHRDDPIYRPIALVRDASLAQVAAVAGAQARATRRCGRAGADPLLPGGAGSPLTCSGTSARSPMRSSSVRSLKVCAAAPSSGSPGVEQEYNRQLMGEDGARRVVVNSIGREIEAVGEIHAIEGRRLQLTLDYDLQRAAENAFALAGFSGSAVVMDPLSGEVLALVSLPAYDPNAFALGIDRVTWDSLNTDPLKPLQNRALQGRYSPGSTFKIVVAVAALEEGVVTPDFKVNCRGGASFYSRYFRCHAAHGTVDMHQAIEKSCNTYFYHAGKHARHRCAAQVGHGAWTRRHDRHRLGLMRSRGIMPSTEWKLEHTGEKWYPGETISVSIGQGQVSVTPVSMAVMMAAVANGGTRLTPYLLKAIDAGEGWTPQPPPPPQSIVNLKPETIETLHRGLWLVVNRAGTGGRARIAGRDVLGKTGTAQVISTQGRQAAGDTDKDLRDHGWFVFAVPSGNPELAGVVFAEHAEHGYLAAPIAKHVMETYFAKQDGRPLPGLPLPSRPPAVMMTDGQTDP